METTTQMVNLAIKLAIHDEASTTRNKWLTLDVWKTIISYNHNLDDEHGFSMNTLTRAVKLFGSAVNSKEVSGGGNSTGGHLSCTFLIKYDKKDGKKSGTDDHVRFLLLVS